MTSILGAWRAGAIVFAAGLLGLLALLVAAVLRRTARARAAKAIARAEAEKLRAAREAVFQLNEAKAVLIQFVCDALRSARRFSLDEAVGHMAMVRRSLDEATVLLTLKDLATTTPSLRAVLPVPLPECARIGCHKQVLSWSDMCRDHAPRVRVVRNGATVTSPRPPETLSMTREQYETWKRDGGGRN